jgi:hypothetical protein
MLLHLLADEDYLSLYPKDSYAIGWILQRLLTPTQDTLLLIEVNWVVLVMIFSHHILSNNYVNAYNLRHSI